MSSPAPHRAWGLITAGGRGQRFQATHSGMDKLLAPLGDRAVIAHSVARIGLHPGLSGAVLTVHPEARAAVESALAPLMPFSIPLKMVNGGESRRASVNAGLLALRELGAKAEDVVAVHDGARPLASPDWLLAALTRLTEAPSLHGVIAAHPVTDTLKRAVGEQHRIAATVSRAGLWAVQTPQVFRVGPLIEAHEAVSPDAEITDDAQLIEGHFSGAAQLELMEASRRNIKITVAEDIALAEAYLHHFTE